MKALSKLVRLTRMFVAIVLIAAVFVTSIAIFPAYFGLGVSLVFGLALVAQPGASAR
jgi:hypothetical protein